MKEEPPDLPSDSPVNVCSPSHAIVTWLVRFLVLLQARHYIPDIAINALLKFLHVLFVVLGRFSTLAFSIASAFPSSVHMLRKHINQPGSFVKFVVCPKCHQLYDFGECVSLSGPNCTNSVVCPYVQYPNHPQIRRRQPCGHLLLRSVQFSSGRRIMYPFKVFPYKSLRQSLNELLIRPGFADLCQHWKSRAMSMELQDIYDGDVWKDFQNVSGKPFLSASLGLGLMMNIDWFQPYKHASYSVGAIYITLMNLPRSVRFKRENVVLIGILPGPSEPKHDINPYLEPLVDELTDLWEGVTMQVCTRSGKTAHNIRCALLCIACDVPAGRKVCGFLGHSARFGCSKCFKEFPGNVGTMNYSGFDRSKWPRRSGEVHRNNVSKILLATSKGQQAKLESTLGCRYSCLLKLPYFDPPRMLIIDPMHNLFLGTGKRMLQLWLIEHGIITTAHFSALEECIDGMVIPADVGRIPTKIPTSFSAFTADQLKNWITIFSIPALYGILPKQHLECWRHFVLACRILCKRSLSTTDIALCDALLLQFCKRAQDLYGESAITPNMHLHGHMKEVLRDYGPVYAFWLFSYERYNGILGNQPNNNRAIETQLVDRFLRDNFMYSGMSELPSEFRDDFSPVLPYANESVGSVGATLSSSEDTSIQLPSSCSRGTLDDDDILFVQSLYRKLNPVSLSDITVNSVFVKYTSLSLNGKSYNSCRRFVGRHANHIALAEWDEAVFGDPPTPVPDALHPDARFRPVQIHRFIKVSVAVQESFEPLLLAVVSWHLPHPDKSVIGKPSQIWHHNKFESSGIHSFLPIHYLKCRCAFRATTLRNESVLIVVPLVE